MLKIICRCGSCANFYPFSNAAGDKTKQVHMEGYAVSGQCMALVRDNILLPTKDAPELGYIRESSDKQYVPDVYYKVSRFFFSIVQEGNGITLRSFGLIGVVKCIHERVTAQIMK